MGQIETKPHWQLKEFDKTLLTAAHYGFMPIHNPQITDRDLDIAKDYPDHPFYRAAEKAAFIRSYLENNSQEESSPRALAYRIPSPGRGARRYSLELVEFTPGVAEAVLLRTGLSILSDHGYKDLIIDINCIGDKESIASYERELQNFIRKSQFLLSAEIKNELKKDIFNLIHIQSPELEEVRQNIPSSISFLSAQSRSYFKEVLEYVEALGIDFQLAPHLVGNKNFCSNTIFAIRSNEQENNEALAVGYCYSKLSKKLGLKKELPFFGINIFPDRVKDKPKSTSANSRTYKSLPRSKFYLVQLGKEAKMRSFSIIELLRKERISVHHMLGKDKITSQFAAAEKLQVPYLIIIGRKEALENSVIVRNVSTRAQETVPVSALPQFLKTISI